MTQNHYHQSIRSEKPSNLSPNTTHNLLVFAKWCHMRLYIDDWYPKPSLVPGCANPNHIHNPRAPKNWAIWPQTRCPSTNISGNTMAIGYSSVRGCATQISITNRFAAKNRVIWAQTWHTYSYFAKFPKNTKFPPQKSGDPGSQKIYKNSPASGMSQRCSVPKCSALLFLVL